MPTKTADSAEAVTPPPATTPREILILLQGGIIHDVLNLPPHSTLAVLDYDIEGAEPERVEISPVDGEACFITRYTA